MTPAADILGVRLKRNSPVVFVRGRGIHAAPGERVFVRLDGEDENRAAMVVIGAGQLLAGTVTPAGRVSRLYTA